MNTKVTLNSSGVTVNASGLHLTAGQSKATRLGAAVLILVGATTDTLAFRNTLELALPTETSQARILLMAVGATAMGLVAAACIGIAYAARRRGQDGSSRALLTCFTVAWLSLGVMMLLVRWLTHGAPTSTGYGAAPSQSQGLTAGFFFTIYLVSGAGTAFEAERSYHPDFSAFIRLGKLVSAQEEVVVRLEGELARAKAAIEQLDGDLDREDHRRRAAILERQALGAELANWARIMMAAALRDPAMTGLTETGPVPELPEFPGAA
jgi:hypothetical protein